MAKKPLSMEDVEKLCGSPHVASVKRNIVIFTPEFKRMAYEQITIGKTMREVFRENGIDPAILGDARIWGFAEKLRNKADREEGFEDLRKQNKRKPVTESEGETTEARLERLEHELAYTRQEVEYLKKLQIADMEARKSWESKQHRK